MHYTRLQHIAADLRYKLYLARLKFAGCAVNRHVGPRVYGKWRLSESGEAYTRDFWCGACGENRQSESVTTNEWLRAYCLHALRGDDPSATYRTLRKVECGTYQHPQRIATEMEEVTCPKCLDAMERQEGVGV